MRQRILGGLAGILVAGLVVYLVEMLAHRLYPPPAAIDASTPEGARALMDQAPLPALVMVVAAWILGALAGGLVARRMGGPGPQVWVVAGFVLLGIVMNVMTIPHPVWMVNAGVLGTIVVGWLLSRRRDGATRPASA